MCTTHVGDFWNFQAMHLEENSSIGSKSDIPAILIESPEGIPMITKEDMHAEVKSTTKMNDQHFWHRLSTHLQECSIHGTNHVTKQHASVRYKTAWILCLLLLTSMCAYMLSMRIVQYLAYPTATSVGYIAVESLDLPSVTVCNLNTFRTSIIDNTALNHSIPAKVLVDILQNGYGIEEHEYPDTKLFHKLKAINMTELSLHAAYRFDPDTVKYCQLDLHHTSCMPGRYSWSYGDYKFANSENNDDLHEHGFKQGGYCNTIHPASYIDKYSLTRFTNEEKWGEFVFDIAPEDYISDMDTKGVILQVHSPFEEPQVMDKGVVVEMGIHAKITVTRTEIQNLPAPYGHCLDTENPSFVNPLKYFKHFSYAACKLECLVEAFNSKCGCVPYVDFDKVGAYISVCNLTQTATCNLENENVKKNFHCKHNCKHSCKETKYKLKVQVNPYPSAREIKTLKRQRNKGRLIKGYFVRIELSYDELGYKLVAHHPGYPMESLFADIGLALCICLGASLVSVVEVVQFGFGELIRMCKK